MYRTVLRRLSYTLIYSFSQSLLIGSHKAMRCCIVKFGIATGAHITDCTQLSKDSENERFESQFIIHGTIGLDCSARSPLALCIRPGGACVVGVHRDESFRGHDKGSALGKILCYCG